MGSGWFGDPWEAEELDPEVEAGLDLIEEIPDDAVTSQASIDSWLSSQNLTRGEVIVPSYYDPSDDELGGRVRIQGAAACVGAILVAVVSNIFLVSKLAKVKKAIKAVGGAKKAYKKLKKAYKKYRAAGHGRAKSAKKAFSASGVSSAARDTLLEVASVSGVINNCF